MNKIFIDRLFIFIIILGQFLTACSTQKQLAKTNTFEPINSAFLGLPTQTQSVFATQSFPDAYTPIPTTINIYVPSFPTPEEVVSNEVVQDGPFTFDLRFYRDAALGANPIAPSLYSDLEGIGIYFVWEYHGPDIPPPVTVYWGIDPDISSLLSQSEYTSEGIKDGDKDGREGGLILPKVSKEGDQLEAVVKIETQNKTYGAVIRFFLKAGEHGLEPDNVTVHPLDTHQNS